jgi:hypothetical protein
MRKKQVALFDRGNFVPRRIDYAKASSNGERKSCLRYRR